MNINDNWVPNAVLALAFLAVTGAPELATAWEQTRSSQGAPVSWSTSCFFYSIHEDGYSALDTADLESLIRESFDAWEDVDCSYFYFDQTAAASVDRTGFNDDKGNVNLLVFREEDNEWPQDESAVIALTSVTFDPVTGVIFDADIEFNAVFYDFGTLDDYPQFTSLVDLQSTVTHEIGHMVGLEHSEVIAATMYQNELPGVTGKRDLHEDDIQGLCHLYPPGSDPELCQEPVCGLDLAGTSDNCIRTGSDDCGCSTPGLRRWSPPLWGLFLRLVAGAVSGS